MIIPLPNERPARIPTPQEQEDWELAQWVWDNHKWIEGKMGEFKGYYKCQWCGEQWTNQIPIDLAKLCVNNPKLKLFKP